jgi:hypothetical protein
VKIVILLVLQCKGINAGDAWPWKHADPCKNNFPQTHFSFPADYHIPPSVPPPYPLHHASPLFWSVRQLSASHVFAKAMDNATNPTPDPPQSAPSTTVPVTTINADESRKNGSDSQSVQLTIQSFTDQALQFLSTASNETIGACLVGLGAGTYFVLGRVGLVLMGVVGGVVLHATWEGALIDSAGAAEAKAAEEKRRREVGLDVVKRALNWQTAKKTAQTDDTGIIIDKIELAATKNLNFDAYPPETAAAMAELTDAVIRDYVKYIVLPPHLTLLDHDLITL